MWIVSLRTFTHQYCLPWLRRRFTVNWQSMSACWGLSCWFCLRPAGLGKWQLLQSRSQASRRLFAWTAESNICMCIVSLRTFTHKYCLPCLRRRFTVNWQSRSACTGLISGLSPVCWDWQWQLIETGFALVQLVVLGPLSPCWAHDWCKFPVLTGTFSCHFDGWLGESFGFNLFNPVPSRTVGYNAGCYTCRLLLAIGYNVGCKTCWLQLGEITGFVTGFPQIMFYIVWTAQGSSHRHYKLSVNKSDTKLQLPQLRNSQISRQ